MRLVDAPLVSCLVAVILYPNSGSSTQECRQCVPLGELTAHAHGISLSTRGLDSAITYHNGTVTSRNEIDATPSYIQLLQRFETASNGSTLHDPWHQWAKFRHHTLSIPSQSRAFNVQASLRSWIGFDWLPWPLAPPPLPPLPPLTPEAEILYELLTRLKRALEAQDEQIYNVGISVPVWFTDAQAVHLFLAAERANISIKDIGVPPAAVAASQGLDLCRTPSDYLPCSPESVMTLLLRDSTLTAAVQHIRRNSYLLHETSYSVRHDLDENHQAVEIRDWREVTRWINDFAKGKGITKAFLFWSEEVNPNFRQAVLDSVLPPVILVSGRAIAQGTATMTKQKVESQDTDCLESVKCEKIREKADQLVGRPPEAPKPPRSEL